MIFRSLVIHLTFLTLFIPPGISTSETDSEVFKLRQSRELGNEKEKCRSQLSGINLKFLSNFVGYGWDQLRSESMGSIFQSNYQGCKTTPDGQYLIPDHVVTIDVKQTYTDHMARFYKDHRDYLRSITDSIGLDASATLPEVPITVSASFSATHKEIKRNSFEKKSSILHTKLQYHAYTFLLDPSAMFTVDFREHMQDIGNAVQQNRSDWAQYLAQTAVAKFGTHVINRAEVGAEQSQEDFVDMANITDEKTSLNDIKAAASLNFFNVVKLSVNAGHQVNNTVKKKFASISRFSKIRNKGSPNIIHLINKFNSRKKREDDELSDDTKIFENFTDLPGQPELYSAGTGEDTLAPLDRSGELIYHLITQRTLPEYNYETVASIAYWMRNATLEYIQRNTFYGCMDPLSDGFNISTNAHVENQCKSMNKPTFGGLYQEIRNLSKEQYLQYKAPDTIGPWFIVNGITGDFKCPEGYEAQMVASEIFNFPDQTLYPNEFYQSTLYACMGISAPDRSGYMFGGLYTDSQPNLFTGSQSCPGFYTPVDFLHSPLTICLSRNYDSDHKYAIEIAGFHSCQTEIRSCPIHYTSQLALRYKHTIISNSKDCELFYCVKEKDLVDPQALTAAKLPPYMAIPTDPPMSNDSFTKLPLTSQIPTPDIDINPLITCRNKQSTSFTKLLMDNVVGLGWDNLRNLPMAPVFKSRFIKCATTPDELYLVPDDILVLNELGTNLIQTAKEHSTYKEYVHATSDSINLDLSAQLKVATIQGSFSKEHQTVKKMSTETKSSILEAGLEYKVYDLLMEGSAIFSQSFRDRLQEILDFSRESNSHMTNYLAQSLVRDYGTDVIRTATVGVKISQIDFINLGSQGDSSTSIDKIKAGAKIALKKTFKLDENGTDDGANFGGGGGELGRETEDSLMRDYWSSMQHSELRSKGGSDITKIMQISYSYEDTKGTLPQKTDPKLFAIDDIVPIARSGVALSQVIINYKSDFKPDEAAILSALILNATVSYYEHNTHRGCTNPMAKGVNFTANADDDSQCENVTSNYHFFGVYQTCTNPINKTDCRDLNLMNGQTGEQTCVRYTSPPSNTYIDDIKVGDVRVHNPSTDDMPWIERTKTAHLHYCMRPGYATVLEDSEQGYMFGGLFMDNYPNPVTSSQSCPGDYTPVRIVLGITICTSKNYVRDGRFTIDFGGFISCETEQKNCPDTFANVFLTRYQVWKIHVSNGYTYKIQNAEGCDLYYCVRPSDIPNYTPGRALRPPFLDASGVKDVVGELG